MTHIWSPTLFSRGIITFQGVLTKFNFLMKFPYLEKIFDLMKYLKYKQKSIFPMWGRVKLNFRDRYERPNIYSKNSSHCQAFLTELSKNDFGAHHGGCTCDVMGASWGASDMMTVSPLILVIGPCKFQQL